MVFDLPNTLEFSSSVPIISACMVVLGNLWPQNILLSDLVNRAMQLLNEHDIETSTDGVAERTLAVTELLDLAKNQGCQLSRTATRSATQISQRPTVNHLSRILASLRDQKSSVVNVHHQNVVEDSFGMFIIELLDGSHSMDDLIEEMLLLFDNGVMEIKSNNEIITDREQARKFMAESLDKKLKQFFAASLLIN